MAGTAWCQKCEAFGHIMPLVGKQAEMSAGVQLVCSFPLFIQPGTLACGRGPSTVHIQLGSSLLSSISLDRPSQMCPEVCLLGGSKFNEVGSADGSFQGSSATFLLFY